MKVPDGSVGKRVKCPRCYFAQAVPASGHLVKGEGGHYVVGAARTHALTHAPGGGEGASEGDSGGASGAGVSSQLQINTALDLPSNPLADDASAGSTMAHVFLADNEIVDTTEMAARRREDQTTVNKPATEPAVHFVSDSSIPRPASKTNSDPPKKKEQHTHRAPSQPQAKTPVKADHPAKPRLDTPSDTATESNDPASEALASSSSLSRLGSTDLPTASPKPVPTKPPQPMPQPVDHDPSAGKSTGKPLPLSSQTHFFVSEDRKRSLDLAGDFEQRGAQAAGLAGQSYPSLLILTWLFRLLAFFAVGSVIRQVIESVDASEGIYLAGQKIFLLVGLVMVIWLLGELASAVRHIAMSSRRL